MPNGCGPAGIISKPWEAVTGSPPVWVGCCDQHDLAYEQGGDDATRAWADALLRDCMIRQGYPVRAWAYWAAVRVFGGRFWKGGGNG